MSDLSDNPDAPAAQPERVVFAMRALGKHGVPRTITLADQTYQHERTVKHDFWAATAFYLSPAGERVVLKVGREVEFVGLPLVWLGLWLRNREMHFYRRLADLPNVPRLLGPVGRTGFAHTYVAGKPLAKGMTIPDGFFDQLVELFQTMHRRGLAYVDTNKPQNILLGDDGKPYLIDFQISWDPKRCWIGWIGRLLFRWAVREDLYHVLKHKKRLRPDELTADELERSTRKSWVIRLHRWLTKPYFAFRRRTFRRLRATGRLMPEGSK